MSKKPRYMVLNEGGDTLYSGNSRLVAWAFWFVNRSQQAVAYDCGVWIVEPSYWVSVVPRARPGRSHLADRL